MSTIFYLLLIAGVLVSISHFVQVFLRVDAKKMVSEYRGLFPNRCMICSYRNYGISHGFTVSHKPTPHDCIEGNDNV